MKNLKISIAAMLLLVSLTNAQEKEKMNHDHSKMNMDGMGNNTMLMAPEFNSQQLAVSYEHYIMIKTALVSSDSNEAKKEAKLLTASLKEVKGAETASNAAKIIENTEDLKSQRIAFSELSDAMAVLVKGNLKSGMIYKDFCPMALGGGAYWLSSEKEILNPYLGDKMLKCGNTESIIK
ncbi:MAG: hypothetical protein CVU01_01785 [Bacteroidetes bacterium HGW-Bacteroidetes-18]|nr:MAG: hypothetical protein CVU01_01785 [Bacteroidetes bacterium HGW-Bacteroidetes-18]